MSNNADTIYALSSGTGKAGVAVIRLSGSQCRFVSETLCGDVPEPRRASLRTLRNTAEQILDKALVLYFEAPKSFTGEDMLELHVHGGRAVISAVTAALSAFKGLRTAEAGEFALRAFHNGRLDLVTAEALVDLIDAETDAQRQFALEQADGGLTRLYSAWRERLVSLRALIESGLDFSDEGDVPDSTATALQTGIDSMIRDIAEHVSGYHRAEVMRDGYRIAIIGPPNAGKSSLLNVLAQREAAIVAADPGTTRDPIEVVLNLGGYKVTVTDTAGIRDGAEGIERIGIDRSRQRADEADLVLELVSSGQNRVHWDVSASQHWLVGSKADIAPRADADLSVSAVSGSGVDELLGRIVQQVKEDSLRGTGGAVRQRHVTLLNETSDLLKTALLQEQDELRAEYLRLASDRVAAITGEIGVEDVLGAIFARFCIGK